MSNKLTPDQEQIYQFIKAYIAQNKHSPYLREIQQACNISSHKSVIDRLNALERKGYIKRLVSEVISRGIKLRRTVRVLADNFEIPTYQVKINYVGLLPLISYYEQSMHGTDRAIKRIFDIVVSLVALVIAIPLFLIIAFLIKMDSPGPVFYVSQRAGRKSKLFNFYKFRSMYVGTDKEKANLLSRSEVKGPIFKIKKDPRITRIGKILRRYSLDELPQLINVLKGDMSLVGPRPLPMEELSKCEEWQLRRLEGKPGIACLAQVRGRSDLSFYKWSKWDLWYIDNWSFGLDLGYYYG